jgi:hypothetical protein
MIHFMLLFVFIVMVFSGEYWKTKYLKEKKRSDRRLTGMRLARQDLSAYRCLAKQLRRQVLYYKYK